MIAETLASKGHRVTTSTMHDWLSKDAEAQAGFAAAVGGAQGGEPAPSTPLELPPPAPARAPRSAEEPEGDHRMSLEEFGAWLGRVRNERNSSDPTATTCPECRRRLACRPEDGAPTQVALRVTLWDGEPRYVTSGGLLSRDRSHARIFGSKADASQYAELHLDPKTERVISVT